MKREHPRDAIARLTNEVDELRGRVAELERRQGLLSEDDVVEFDKPQGWRHRAHERSE